MLCLLIRSDINILRNGTNRCVENYDTNLVFVSAFGNFALLLYLLRKFENVRITLTDGRVGEGETEFVVVRV